jgi:hypothetical protein
VTGKSGEMDHSSEIEIKDWEHEEGDEWKK